MAAALEHLLTHTRRIPLSHISSFSLINRRSFCSSNPKPSPQSQSEQNNNNPPDHREPPQIQPVSYAVKPRTEPVPEKEQPALNLDFSREDIRYVKDAPLESIFSSYPKRVAPLPEDRTNQQRQETDLERERARIEAADNNRAFRRVFASRIVEDEIQVPFPTLIKVDKKQSERTVYDLQDAIRQVKANAKRNFNETVEAHVNLGIDRRRSDLGVSGAVVLPHGTGKIVKVAVFAEGAAADEASAAGADVVGGDELIEEIRSSGKINFDKCIATHSMMQRVTKIGKILRGLTPNAKKGTVTNNVGVAVKEAKQGLLDFRMKDAIVQVGLGKVSFPEESLHENIGAFVNALLLAKPAGLKKTSKYAGYVNSFHLCSTMGPGVPVSIQSLSRAADLYNKLRPQ